MDKTNVKKPSQSIDNVMPVIEFKFFGRVNFTPCISPFEIKLETYMRAVKVPYKVSVSLEASAKGKSPWATFNEEAVADSFFVIERLKQMNFDLDSHLSPEQHAISTAFIRMIEEATVMCILCYRYQYYIDHELLNDDIIQLSGDHGYYINKIKLFIMFKKYRLMVWLQGTGKHSLEEVNVLIKRDLSAISICLGEKKFLMGDNLCSVDCSLFGMLSLLVYNMPNSPATKYIREYFPNLLKYLNNIKSELWPDYLQCITNPDEFCKRYGK